MKKGKIENYIINEVKDHEIPSVTEIKSRIDYSKEPLRYVRDSNFYNYRSRLVFCSLVTFVIGVVLCFGIVYGVYRFDHRGSYYAEDVLSKEEIEYVNEQCEWFEEEPVLMTSVINDISFYIYKGKTFIDNNYFYLYKIVSKTMHTYSGEIIIKSEMISFSEENNFGILCEVDIDSEEIIEFSIQIQEVEKTYSFSN